MGPTATSHSHSDNQAPIQIIRKARDPNLNHYKGQFSHFNLVRLRIQTELKTSTITINPINHQTQKGINKENFAISHPK